MERLFQQAAYVLYILAAVVSVLLMLGLGGLGFWEMGRAVLVGFHRLEVQSSIGAEQEALIMTLKGLEFLFLAPVSYLVVVALSGHIRDVAAGTVDPKQAERVTGAKAFVISLMIGVVATDLVRRILQPGGIEFWLAVSESLVVVVLGTYFVALELLAFRASASRRRDGA